MPNHPMISTGAGLALALAGLAGAVHADALSEAAGQYRIEPSSHIGFHIGEVGGDPGITGDFSKFHGTFRIDAHNFERSSVQFALMPASVRTGEARIDKFLRSDAVFNADAYPEIRFRSTKVKRTGDDTALIEGELTARGKTHPAEFTATVGERTAHSITFHVQGSIQRSAYGMDAGTPLYFDVVDFDIQLNGSRN